MNQKDYLKSKAVDYKQYLLKDLKFNNEYKDIVNLLFFPLACDVEKWLDDFDSKDYTLN